MSAKMIAEEGSLAGLVVSLDAGKEWILGRGPQATVLIADPQAGDRHLRLSVLEDGMQVEPLEGNNVEINDEEVLGSHLLRHGDVLKIGSSRFRFYREIGQDADLLAGTARPPPVSPVLSHPPQPHIETPPKEDELPPPKEDNLPDESVEESLEEDSIKKTPVSSEKGDPSSDPFFKIEDHPPSSEDLLSHIDFGIDDTSPFLLKVIRGPNNGAEFPMEIGHSYVLGTDPQVCDVIFHDMSISRQHARITVNPDQTLSIEDLNSRNGTMVDDAKITAKAPLGEHIIVILGTTSFIVFNRESERSTIITPFLPSIVRSLQDETEKGEEAKGQTPPPIAPEAPVMPLPLPAPPPEPAAPAMSPFKKRLLIGLAAGTLALFAVGTSTLFQTTTFVAPAYDTAQEIDKLLKPYPNLQYSYNKESKRLFLIGHVLNSGDRTQLMYTLESLPFVRTVDDENLIIDEYVLKENNQILSKNPAWSGISLRSTSPGRFVITGYLKKRADFELLKDFLAQDFRYLDRLDNRVIVEESVVSNVRQLLEQAGLHKVTVHMSNGDLSLEGTIPPNGSAALDHVIEQVKKQTGIRTVNNFISTSAAAARQPFIDLTSTYEVKGSATAHGKDVSVFINGRILIRGDYLDGMLITDIQRNTVFLEKDGVKYRIEYNK